MRGTRRGFLCPATLLPMLMLALSINQMIRPLEAARQSDDYADIEDNDFAEFDFEDETDESLKVTDEEEDDFDPMETEDDEAEVEVESEGEDEFINEPKPKQEKEKPTPPPLKQPIKIVNIPAHLRTNWENYYMEITMIIGIIVYFLNFFTGKTKNQKIANQWFAAHRPLLESQFSLVGDDGNKDMTEIQEPLTKESENLFSFWCSGRICCEGMLVELKLLKRQDLVGVISNFMKPAHDQVHVRVDLPPGYFIMSEVAEVASAMLDAKILSMFRKFPEHIDTIHFSDQYTGPKPADDQQPLEP